MKSKKHIATFAAVAALAVAGVTATAFARRRRTDQVRQDDRRAGSA